MNSRLLKKLFSIFSIAVVLTSLFGLLHPATTLAQTDETGNFQITNFESEMHFTESDDILVTEKITVEFFTYRHGLLRDIPFNFHTRDPLAPNVQIDIGVKSVTDADGEPWNYTINTIGDYREIKIGDADTLVTGIQQYNIEYEATNAVNFFEKWDELYWNATGNEWPVYIQKSKATVFLPEKIEKKGFPKAKCFTGEYGSTAEDCKVEKFEDRVVFTANNSIGLSEGMTVVVGIPKGILREPTFLEEYWFVLLVNLGCLMPFPVLAFLLYLKAKKSAEAPGRGTIVPEFDAPDKLTPSEVGTLVDNFAENRDISAIVIDLAIRKYIKIEELEKKLFGSQDYNFHLLKSDFTGLKEHEIELLEGFFGKDGQERKERELSSMKYKFADRMQRIKSMLYDILKKDGYFSGNPNSTRGIYIATGIALGVILGWFVLGVLVPFGGILSLVGLIATSIIIIVFGFIMPTRTQKGVLALEHILGLKDYLKTAETDRLKVTQGPNSEFIKLPNKTIKLFEKLLPYAMVLGVEKEWSDKFKDIYTEPPEWYSGHHWNTFNSYYLTQSLGNATSSMSSTFVSSYSSSASGGSGFSGSGGSSGGGGGGGGGGSW